MTVAELTKLTDRINALRVEVPKVSVDCRFGDIENRSKAISYNDGIEAVSSMIKQNEV